MDFLLLVLFLICLPSILCAGTISEFGNGIIAFLIIIAVILLIAVMTKSNKKE